MRKFISIIIFGMMTIFAFANFEAIKFNNLPQNKEFRKNLEWINNNSNYMNHYIVEWDFEFSKEDLIEKTFSVIKNIKEQKNRSYDLELLELIALRYLYNLDAENISEQIEKKVSYLKLEFPKEYRTYWIYGNYLVGAAKLVEGMNEFFYVTNKIEDYYNLHPAFLENFSYACLLSSMYKNSFIALEVASLLRGKNIKDSSFYNIFLSTLKKPDKDHSYTENETWNIQKYKEHYKVFSRILGTAVPIKNSWKLSFTGLNDNKAFIKITPDKIRSTKDREIGITILFQFFVGDKKFQDFIQNTTKSFNIIKQTKREINNIDFSVFEYENLDVYENIGGAHGYLIAAEIPTSKHSNCNVEFPYIPRVGSENNTSYYTIQEGYDRVEHTIFLGIMLDSCNEVFNESSDLFWDLIANSVFE